MEERGLTTDDLVIPAAVLERKDMISLIDSMDVVLSA